MKTGVKKLDIAIVAVVLCIAALSFLCLKYGVKPGNYVTISVDSKTVCSLPLSENTKYDVVKDSKVTNTVVIENGFAYVDYADCPDKICSKHKKISRSGESIVCLPNKVVVTVCNENNQELDGVAK